MSWSLTIGEGMSVVMVQYVAQVTKFMLPLELVDRASISYPLESKTNSAEVGEITENKSFKDVIELYVKSCPKDLREAYIF